MEITIVCIIMMWMFLYLLCVGNIFQVNVSFDVIDAFEDCVTTSVLHGEAV